MSPGPFFNFVFFLSECTLHLTVLLRQDLKIHTAQYMWVTEQFEGMTEPMSPEGRLVESPCKENWENPTLSGMLERTIANPQPGIIQTLGRNYYRRK